MLRQPSLREHDGFVALKENGVVHCICITIYFFSGVSISLDRQELSPKSKLTFGMLQFRLRVKEMTHMFSLRAEDLAPGRATSLNRA
jgi:hypothetical protein